MTTQQYVTREEFTEVKSQVANLQVQALDLMLSDLERSPIYSELKNVPSETQSPKRSQPVNHPYLGASTLDEGSIELDRRIRSYMEGHPETDYLSAYETITQQ